MCAQTKTHCGICWIGAANLFKIISQIHGLPMVSKIHPDVHAHFHFQIPNIFSDAVTVVVTNRVTDLFPITVTEAVTNLVLN